MAQLMLLPMPQPQQFPHPKNLYMHKEKSPGVTG